MALGTARTHVRPAAWHRDFPERLMVHLESGAWALWTGDGSNKLVVIPDSLAAWMFSRPEMIAMPGPLMWFDRSSLPLDPTSPKPLT